MIASSAKTPSLIASKLVLILAFPLGGCASAGKSALLGAGIGAGSGFLVGANTGASMQGRAVASAVGALIGGGIGYLASRKAQPTAVTAAKIPTPAEMAPRLKRPEVRKIWVPDQISGDEFIQGHWKYLIERPAVWSQEN